MEILKRERPFVSRVDIILSVWVYAEVMEGVCHVTHLIVEDVRMQFENFWTWDPISGESFRVRIRSI
jgi:hypothetical protein